MFSQKVNLSQIYSILRKMAKTNKWQTLYAQSKEGCVILFKNAATYTDIQIAFLQYLSFYNSLHTDIYMNEVGEIVLEDETYEDAYQHYKNKVKKSDKKSKLRTPQEQDKTRERRKKQQGTNISNTHVVFSKPRIRK